ncbi:hypothetical protein [Bacillus sp. NPDC093026]|uniref:hypothetical protein n=1 Tax=Bacillus sp. NPDC093026 TaxID=3363948 RepID=UPI0038092948
MNETRDLMSAMKLTKTKAGGDTWYQGFEDGQVKSNYNHIKGMGKTIICVTHDQKIADGSDRVIHLS